MINILTHNTCSVSLAVSLRINQFVQYFNFSFSVSNDDDANCVCSLTSLSKSDKILLISDAVSHTDMLFNAT